MNERGGWSSEAAGHYLRMADVLVPGRRNVLAIVAGVATAFAGQSPRFLDLGCGSGDVTAEILKRRPDASFLLLDFTEEMTHIARERFRGNLDVEVVRHDLDSGVPGKLRPAEFDAVVSCFTTHHIDPERRPELYRGIRRVLRPDGVFVNGDRFVGDAPAIAGWEHERWVDWMTRRIRKMLGQRTTAARVRETQAVTDERLGDRPGTVWDMREDLLSAGFRYVDCLLKNQNIAVLTASGSR